MGYQLILDTSSNQLAIGIADEHEVLYKTQYVANQKQSELTTLEIEKALKSLDIDSKELTRIVVSIGPGSYTGVRITLTIAKVMSYVHKIPVCTLSSLQALAGIGPKILTLLDARSDKVYVGVFEFGKPIVKEKIIEIKELPSLVAKFNEYIVVGDRHLLNLSSNPYDLIENMYRISKKEPDVKNVDTLMPTYLKD